MTNVVIVVSHDSPDDICGLVRRYRSAGLRVVVVENASGRGAPPCDADLYLSGHGNVGYGAALNYGYVRAREQFGPISWVILSNADATPSPALLAALTAGRLPAGADLVGFVESSGQEWRRPMPSARATWAAMTGRFRALMDSLPPSGTYPVGALLAIRGHAFERLRGFDPRYFLYFEEVDLIDRANRLGLCFAFASPELGYVHAAHSSTQALAPASQFELGRSAAIHFKNGRQWRLFPWLGVEIVRLAVLAGRAVVAPGRRHEREHALTLRGLLMGLFAPSVADRISRRAFDRPPVAHDGVASRPGGAA